MIGETQTLPAQSSREQMPQLSTADVWSCWERCRNQDRRGQNGAEVERKMLVGLSGREREREEERAGGVQQGLMSLSDRFHWRQWSKGYQCAVPVAAVGLVLLEESPLYPSVSLSEAGGRLILAGTLCAMMGLFISVLHFLQHYGRKIKQVLPQNSDVILKKNIENQQACLPGQSDAGHLEADINTLADGLVVSLLHEALPDSSEAHIRGLLTRLEAVSRAIHRGGSTEEMEKQEKSESKDRVTHIRFYLQDRVSSLRSLLQVQRECEVSVCEVQSGLQKRWALLEKLHTRVTLSPDSTQTADEPHTVLTDTESLFDELGQFKSKVGQCRTQLETSINLLQSLRSSQQGLAETAGTSVDSTWTKDLLQSSTDLFAEIQEDFTSLEQQTSNFVIHLRGLNVFEKEKLDRAVSSPPSFPPPALPVYTAVKAPPDSHSDPETDPDPSELSQKSHSKLSAFHLLCGRRRRRSSP